MPDESSQTLTETVAAQRDASRLPHGDANLTPLAQLRRMQRVLFEMTQEPEIDKREAAQVACAWERLEGRKAILTMRPAPKPIDVSLDRKRKRARSGGQAEPPPVPSDIPGPAKSAG